MSEAVLDEVIEHIADGMSVDWGAFNGGTVVAGDNRFLKCLRIISDVANLHRADAMNLMTEMPTAVSMPLPPVSPGVPDVWGKYRLANRVGAGSYGAVYRAWDSDLERDVAMKILHVRFGDTRLKDKLLKEGRALARISHNNVVQVFGVEAHEDRVALCMEFVEGQTLDEVIRRGTLSAREAIGIGEDLCRALAAVHGAGYIHRDVKAKNVMRDARGRIVLMDFGTGRMADRPGTFGDRAGTPLYMAPEVLNGEPASPSSDVYSLGVLLYFLVSGQYPVDARTIDELQEAHAQRRHRWLSERRPDLPVAFMQVVERAIALDPQERYTNPSELLAALSALKVGPHPWLWAIARPFIAVAVLLIGVTAIGFLATGWFNLMLARSGFTNETPLDWFVWGQKANVGTLVILLMGLVPLSALVVARRVAVAISSHARAIDDSARRGLRSLAHRLRLDEASVLASCALIVSTSSVVVACWHLAPFLVTFLTKELQTATDEQLWQLSHDFVFDHNHYRQVFAVVAIITVVVWVPVWKLVKKGQSIHWGFVAAGLATTVCALTLLHFPYRLLYFNDVFDAVTWNGQRCYVVGERASQDLLFCATLQPPRNRIVAKNDPAIVPLGIRESIFKYFERSKSPGSAPTP